MSDKHTLSTEEQEKNQRIINGFKHNDSAVILESYEAVYPMVANLVTGNSGSEEDAKETMSECFEVFYKLCIKADFSLRAKFSSFVYSICYRIWMKKLRQRQKDPLHQVAITNAQEDGEHPVTLENKLQAKSVEEEVTANEMSKIVRLLLAKLTEDCKTIFQLKHQEDKSHEEIAEQLNITVAISRSRIYRCSIKFAKAIKQNPFYHELMDAYPFLKKYIDKKRKS